MKRQVQQTGIRKWFGGDFLDIQNESLTAIEAHYAPYGSCIIKDCEVSGNDIAPGIVFIDGKIQRFLGATGLTFPCYLKTSLRKETREYKTGGSKDIAEIYEAVVSETIPAEDYITITTTGGKTFRQAFQDANHRMVSDSKISEWNGSKTSAINTIRGSVLSAYNTLGKLYDWTVSAISIAKSEAINTASTDATTKANLAKSGAIATATAEVRGEDVGSESPKFSLKKLYDWAVGKLANKPNWDEAYANMGKVKRIRNDGHIDLVDGCAMHQDLPNEGVSSYYYAGYEALDGKSYKLKAGNSDALEGHPVGYFAKANGDVEQDFAMKDMVGKNRIIRNLSLLSNPTGSKHFKIRLKRGTSVSNCDINYSVKITMSVDTGNSPNTKAVVVLSGFAFAEYNYSCRITNLCDKLDIRKSMDGNDIILTIPYTAHRYGLLCIESYCNGYTKGYINDILLESSETLPENPSGTKIVEYATKNGNTGEDFYGKNIYSRGYIDVRINGEDEYLRLYKDKIYHANGDSALGLNQDRTILAKADGSIEANNIIIKK